jgi:hypothetical protein
VPIYFKNFRDPDNTMQLDGVAERQVELGDLTVGRQKLEPGWRWSTHVRPHVGGELCQARHVGVMLSGRLGIKLRDGTTFELGPDDVFDIPPGHDGYVIGHEPVETVEWAGSRAFWGTRAGAHGRALATLLFTDLVDSTAIANRLGDGAWRTLLSEHFESARAARTVRRPGGQDHRRRSPCDVRRTGTGPARRGGDPAGGER